MAVSRRVCCWQAELLGRGDARPRVCPCGALRGWQPPKRLSCPWSFYEYFICPKEGVLMKRPVKTEGGARKGLPITDQRFREEYPTIVEYLSTLAYEDGSPRAPSALSLFIDDGVMKGALNDKDCKRSLYATGETLEAVLGALEAALCSAEPLWRSWTAGKKK